MDSARPSLVFIGLFGLIYLVFHLLYHLIPDAVLANVVYRWGINAPAVWLINTISPIEQAVTEAHRILSPRAALEIVRGCDGSGVFFIASAAMLAFRARLAYKIAGVAASFAVVYLLNQARVVGLYFAIAYRPEWFLPLHTFYIPTFLIVVVCVLFLAWAHTVTRSDASPA